MSSGRLVPAYAHSALALGGSLDPEPDTQSPFLRCERIASGRACAFYGVAEFTRDTDFAILAETANLARCRSHRRSAGPRIHFRCLHPEALVRFMIGHRGAVLGNWP